MNKIIVALCEGQHDISFLSRVLSVDGFKPYEKKIKQFISPLDMQFKTEYEKEIIADKKLGFRANHKLPSVALQKEKTLLLFHNMGGDNRLNECKEVLEMYKMLKGNGEDDFSDFDLEYRFIFLQDADEIGIEKRVEELIKEFNLEGLSFGDIIEKSGNEYGVYIFHETNNSYGDLEDLLIELMYENNEGIFNNSLDYINKNELNDERKREFLCNSNEERYKGSSKYKQKKSRISVAGQLQFSGMSNSVIISKTDYIKRDKLKNNDQCKLITSLFN